MNFVQTDVIPACYGSAANLRSIFSIRRSRFFLLLTLIFWGQLQAAVPPQISPSLSHTVALHADGSVYAWGQNIYGELGDGTTTNRLVPVEVIGLKNITTVASGRGFSYALRDDGSVWAWGLNNKGQLGMGDTQNRSQPTRLNIELVTKLWVGREDVVYALKLDGSLWAWGDTKDLTLFDTNGDVTLLPQRVTTISGVTDISSNFQGTCATVPNENFNVWCWAKSIYPSLTGFNHKTTPSEAFRIPNLKSFGLGWFHNVFLRATGIISTYGANTNGELCMGSTSALKDFQYPSFPAGTVASVAADINSTYLLTNNGELFGCGKGGFGSITNPQPTKLANLGKILSIAPGAAIQTDGKVYMWGSSNENLKGRLGNGTTQSSNLPEAVARVQPSVSLATPLAQVSNKDSIELSLTIKNLAAGEFNLLKKENCQTDCQKYDIYVAVLVPGNSQLLFMSSPTLYGSPSFTTDIVPYLAAQSPADQEGDVIALSNVEGLPSGTYQFYAVVIAAGANPLDSASWIGDLGSTSFVYTNQ